MFGYVIGTNSQKERNEVVRAICWNIFYGLRFLIIIYVANTTNKEVSSLILYTDIILYYVNISTY